MLEAIFSWLLSGIADGFDAIFKIAIDIANLSISDFVARAPIVSTLYIILRDVGLGLIAALFCYHLIKYFTGDISGVRESPIKMLGRSAIAVALVFWGNNVLEFIMNLFTYPYQQLANVPNTHYDFANALIDGLRGGLTVETVAGLTEDTLDAVPMLLITLVAVIVLAVKVLGLLIEIIERYLLLNTLVFTSPIVYPTVSSEGTMQIFRSWVSMFLGQCILMLMNVWSLKVLISILNANSESPTDYLVKLFIAVSFCKIASRLDSYMQMLGINVGTTGGSMLLDIAVAGRTAAGMINGLAGLGGGSRSMSGKGVSALGLGAAKNANTVAGAFWGGGGGIGATIIAKAGAGIRGGIAGGAGGFAGKKSKSGVGFGTRFSEAVDKTVNHGFTIDGKGNVTGLSSASMKQGLSIGQDRKTENPIIQGPQAAQAQFMAQNLERKNLSPQEKTIMRDTVNARDAGFADKAIMSSPKQIKDEGINNATLSQMTAGTTDQNDPRKHISFADSVENTDNLGFNASQNTLAGFAATVNGEQTDVGGNIKDVVSGNNHISGIYETKNETVPVLDADGNSKDDDKGNKLTEQKGVTRAFDICNQAGYDALPTEKKNSYSAFRGSDGKTRYLNMTEVATGSMSTNMNSPQSSNVSTPVTSQANTVEPLQQTSNVTEPVTSQANIVEPSQQTSNVTEPVTSQANTVEPLQQTSNVTEPVTSQANTVEPLQQTSNATDPVTTQANTIEAPQHIRLSDSVESIDNVGGNVQDVASGNNNIPVLDAEEKQAGYDALPVEQENSYSASRGSDGKTRYLNMTEVATGTINSNMNNPQSSNVSDPMVIQAKTLEPSQQPRSVSEPVTNKSYAPEPSHQPRSVSEPVTNKTYTSEPSHQPRSVSEPVTNKTYTSEPSRQSNLSETVTRKVNITETSYQTRVSEVSQQPSQPNPASYKSHNKPPKFKGKPSPFQSTNPKKGNQNKKK